MCLMGFLPEMLFTGAKRPLREIKVLCRYTRRWVLVSSIAGRPAEVRSAFDRIF